MLQMGIGDRDQHLAKQTKVSVFFVITVSNMAEENRQAFAAQDRNAHFQQEIATAFTQLTAQIGALSNSFGNASIGQFITPFDGKNSKNFHP